MSLIDSKVESLKSALRAEMGADNARIDHALAVHAYACELMAREGGEPSVVHAAALLHDIGIPLAEEKHGSAAGKFQELEGPPLARRIMAELSFDEAVIEHVCRIVGSHHSAGDIETIEFCIIWDADWLVNFPAEHGQKERVRQRELVDAIFRTTTGKRLAGEAFLAEDVAEKDAT